MSLFTIYLWMILCCLVVWACVVALIVRVLT